jgi:flagellar hook-associated protein 1 FlgK
MDELSQDSGDALLRDQLKQSVITLTNNMQLTANQLYDYREEQNKNVETIVNEINQTSEQISDLNEMIYEYELSGNTANDLRDQRNLLVDDLSNYIDIDVSESTSGEYRIDVNGHPLVDHMNAYEITLKSDVIDANTDTTYVSPYWGDTDTQVDLTGGKLKATIDIRDSMDADNPGIAYYIDMLNNLAEGLVEEFNAVHTQGYTLPYDGNNDTSETGIDMFDANCTEARNITLSDEILEDVSNFALSSELIDENI